jgi:hypothetical protein
MSPPTILVRQAAHVVHDGHRPGLLTSWLRWKRDQHLATAANRRVSCALQRRNERLHQPSSFSFCLFCISIVGENSRLGMLFFPPLCYLYMLMIMFRASAWDEQVQNAHSPAAGHIHVLSVAVCQVPATTGHRPPCMPSCPTYVILPCCWSCAYLLAGENHW